MSATTLDAIVDRVRSLCVGAPFNWTEAVQLDSFGLTPTGAIDGAFRVEGQSQQPRGWMAFQEECTDLLAVTVARPINDDYQATRRLLLKAGRSLTAAVTRDGAVTSGLYGVVDQGRAWTWEPNPSAGYLALRITLPVNYEAQL